MSTGVFCVGLNEEAKKKTVVREGKRYKYLLWSKRSDKSWQCHGLSAAVLLYGIATPLVWHYHTEPGSKGIRKF